jgi:sulfate adenylyltransferase subunit 2
LRSNLRQLEAEAIYIIRETVAEFQNPVMLYSIGKDSGVMLHLALKAFAPATLPFPLLHVDTTWKFREMIAFRDETAKRLGLELMVHVNQDGVAGGISPVVSGSSVHTQVMKTEALRPMAINVSLQNPQSGEIKFDAPAERQQTSALCVDPPSPRYDET